MNNNEWEKRKELERIKWDYWNKSKIFILFWKYIRANSFEWANRLNGSTPLPDQFKPKIDDQNRKVNHPILQATREYWPYFLYQDHENGSFEEYWTETKFLRDAKEGNEKEKRRVEDYRGLITGDIDVVVDMFKRKENREPTIDELKDHLVNWKMDTPCAVWLEITQIAYTDKEAKERGREVTRILKKRIHKTKPEPTALRRYLKCLELREKGDDYIKIFNELHDEKHYADKDRAAKRDVSKARKIIKNLETRKPIWWA